MDNLLTNVLAQRIRMAAAFAAPAEPPAKPLPNDPNNMMDNANGNGSGSGNGEHQLDDVKSVFTDEMRVEAAAVVEEWADTDTLDEGEGFGDRLYALVVGNATDGDGEMTDDESEYAADLAQLVGDYLEARGIDGDDIDALLDNFENDIAARVHDVLLDKMPQGEEAMLDATDRFVNGDAEDGEMMDATYRKVLAIRQGKKVRLNKRIGGTVKLTAGQKSAVRKMQRKAFSGTAKRKRARSMRIRMKMIGK